jgi:HPt (histidine-containing phosphotransfer) domain-containing protein
MTEDILSSIELAAKRAFIEHSGRAISEVLSDLNALEVSFEKALDTSARLLHTIKGGAAFLKYREIASIAGELENLIRCETVKPFPGLLQRLKDGLQGLESKIQQIDAGSPSDEVK